MAEQEQRIVFNPFNPIQVFFDSPYPRYSTPIYPDAINPIDANGYLVIKPRSVQPVLNQELFFEADS